MKPTINIPDEIPLININDALIETLNEVNKERSGNQYGLYSRWNSLNILQGRYFRFGQVNLFCSLSGHGKSFMFNLLKQDFSEIEDLRNGQGDIVKNGLNSSFKDNVLLLYFGFEQTYISELIRSLSGITKFSYSKIISSEYDLDLKDFTFLSDEDYKIIENKANYLKNRPIYYINKKLDTKGIYEIITKIKRNNPNYKLVLFFDHNFLIAKKSDSVTDIQLTQDVANLYIVLSKLGCMVNALHQMNNEIKDINRLTRPELHYPMDKDIYCGSQIFWACDNVYIFPYQPFLLNIDYYSPLKLKTQFEENGELINLIVCRKIKSRNGVIGERYFKNYLSQGRILSTTIKELKNYK